MTLLSRRIVVAGHALSAAARDGVLIEIPGEQHNAHFSAPQAVAAAIEGWAPSAR